MGTYACYYALTISIQDSQALNFETCIKGMRKIGQTNKLGSRVVKVMFQSSQISYLTMNVNLGLSNRSSRIGFVFESKLNGLKTPRPEPDLFNKQVEKSNLKPFNI